MDTEGLSVDWRFRTTPTLRRAIEKVAVAEDRTMASLIRICVIEGLHKRGVSLAELQRAALM
jgi:hypothetical protein